MKLTAEQYADAASRGFKPYWHKIKGFAEACYDMNRYEELRNCMTDTADKTDCDTWGIDAAEWRKAQKEAIELAMAHHDDE